MSFINIRNNNLNNQMHYPIGKDIISVNPEGRLVKNTVLGYLRILTDKR
jgi:hypothetical protein